MDIFWSEVRALCLQAYKVHFGALATDSQAAPGAYVPMIYAAYRNSAARVFAGGDKGAVESAASDWPGFATKLIPHEARQLQIQRDVGGKKDNFWLASPSDVKPGDNITAVVTNLSAAAKVARLQVVVKAPMAGQALYNALAKLDLSKDPVGQWKVMNPEDGAKGPDSAVFYLTAPLKDQKTSALCEKLKSPLAGQTDDQVAKPLGLLTISPALFGFDLPSKDQQSKVLYMSIGFGSAGWIIASMLDAAAYNAAKFPAKDPKADIEAHIKAHLRNVVEKGLGWSLKD